MNPLLPFEFCIPDCEARVMPDGLLYLYGSRDILKKPDYCSSAYQVFSTSDMKNWTDHGISFASDEEHMRGLWPDGTPLYAPDAICRDGKYYLYFCTPGGGEGVAQSDSPAGPFTAVGKIEGADGRGIDPAVFLDDDGQAYYFWGQFSLCGAKMNPDMKSLDLSSVRSGILTEYEHGFHEGSSIRKKDGRYYLVYTDISRGKATCLGYAVADSPLGPYKKMGILLDNIGCDPDTWNDHGSIECFRGQWYVFYHRSSEGSRNTRRMCAEPITFEPDGTIREVKMTCGGAGGPLCASEEIIAARAAQMAGKAHVTVLEPYGAVLACTGNAPNAGFMRWASYPDLDFAQGLNLCTVTARGRGTLTFVTENGFLLGGCEVDSEDFAPVSFPVSPVSAGVHPLWILFGNSGVDVLSFRFQTE